MRHLIWTLVAVVAFSTMTQSAAWGQSRNRKQQKLERIAEALGISNSNDRINNNDRNNNDRNNNDRVDNNRDNAADNHDPLAKGFSADERIMANTAAFTNLSDEEKKLIFYCNLARLNGKKFAETILKPYLKGKTSQYIKSLYTDIAKVQNLPMLKPDGILCEVCASHCADMDKNNFYGHYSSNGTGPFDRMEKKGYKGRQRAESVSAGYQNAIDICIQLLIDDGITSLHHRKCLLGSQYKVVGVAITKHKKWRHCCTLDLGDLIYKKM